MVELHTATAVVTGIWGPLDRCDAVVRAVGDQPNTIAGRVAADEVMLIDLSGSAVREAVGDQSVVTPGTLGSLALDVSGGWSCLVLEGPDTVEAFSRLSELALPDAGFAQGEVADVGAKIVVQTGRIIILVPASVAEAVRDRIHLLCADLLGSTEPLEDVRRHGNRQLAPSVVHAADRDDRAASRSEPRS